MTKESIITELLDKRASLYGPFPTNDTKSIKRDFAPHFHEDMELNPDLNTYWMNIGGSFSYVVKRKEAMLLEHQILWTSPDVF